MALFEIEAPEELKESFLKLVVKADQRAKLLVPLPVYVLSLHSLARGRVAPDARQAGWQFLAIGPDGVTVSGDVSKPTANQPPAASRSRGPTVQKALEIYQKAREFEQVRDSQYQARVLRIPGLQIEAFWLRRMPEKPDADQLNADFVVPFRTFDAELSSQIILRMKQFLSTAQPMALRQLKSVTPED